MEKIENLLVCPKCFEKVKYKDVDNVDIICPNCNINYNTFNGIPVMLMQDVYNKIDEEKSTNFDINKNHIMRYYSKLSSELESKYGRFIKFMNCGYVANQNTQFAVLDLKEEMVERNSVKLLLEIVGSVDCNDKRIVEIGCGRGGNIHFLNKFFMPEFIVGIDICLENIISCDKRKQSNSYYCVADAESIPFTHRYFDIAINIESSFHYSDLFKFYENVHRILKRGAYFLYADVLPVNKFREIEVYFNYLNFEILRNQEITSNVLLSFENIASSYVGTNKNILNEFLEMLDSRNYRKMKAGEAKYRIYTARKR